MIWIGIALGAVALLAVAVAAGCVWAQMGEMDEQGEVMTHDDDLK